MANSSITLSSAHLACVTGDAQAPALGPSAAELSQSISTQGQQLAQLIDSMDVEQLWGKSVHVNWFTGEHQFLTPSRSARAITSGCGTAITGLR